MSAVDPSRPRCSWAGTKPHKKTNHDNEWGVPCHDDQQLFERLMLEVNQAGLSWSTVLRKRPAFWAAFDGFHLATVAAYDQAKIDQLLLDAGIIRNRQKIQAAITNARALLAVCEEQGSFDAYAWSFVGGRPLRNPHESGVPARTIESDALSKDLKKRGFTFVGSTIVYAFMQSVGMVDDHAPTCFRYQGD